MTSGGAISLLPADYAEYTAEGQRQCRTALASLGGSPELEVAGWTFFRDYYLMPDPEAGFNPGFYEGRLLESAPLHSQIAYWRYAYDMACMAAPRGSAKSTTLDTVTLRDLVCKPGYRILTIKATDVFVAAAFDKFKSQLEDNERIIDDFGTLRPIRGKGLWSLHNLRLTNRASLQGLSIDGKKRGKRPDLVVVDDVEDDKSDRTRSDTRLQELKEAALKVIAPMLDEGCHLFILGTIISRRSFLYYALTTQEDPRFASLEDGGLWKRVIVPAKDVAGHNTWKAKFTPAFLDKKRALMGDSLFQTEYMNDPRSEEDALFHLTPAYHEYTVEGPDPAETTSPFTVESLCTWNEVTAAGPVARQATWADVVDSLHRFITVDYAPGQSTGSDYTAALVLGLNAANELWVLDGWHGRMPATRVAALTWRLAAIWRVSIVAGEAVAIQMELMNRIREQGEAFQKQYGCRPAVLPVKYPSNLSKEDRIAGLEPRIQHGKLKLPGHRRQSGTIAELYNQLRGFTMDLRNLQYDDVVDALAQSQWVARGGKPMKAENVRPQTPAELLASGQTYLEDTAIPLSSFLNFQDLTSDQLEHIMSVQRGLRQAEALGEEAEPVLHVTLGG